MANIKSTLLNTFTFLLVAVLAGSTVYFYLKSTEKNTTQSTKSQEKSQNEVMEKKVDKTVKEDAKKTIEEEIKLTQPAASSDRPSNPSETYKVGAGETLFAISTKLDMNWTRISEVNNLSSADNIKEGQILIIPSYDEKTKRLYVQFTADIQKANQIQLKANTDPANIYLDPAKTAQNDCVSFYGLLIEDVFTFISKNELDGTAIVEATHGDKKYTINLNQPVKKGKDGIWAISQIIPN